MKDLFAEQPYGKAALKKLGSVPDNFRLYEAGLLGKPPKYSDTMFVTGAEFRIAKTGKNKGKLSIMVEGTQQTVYVSRIEMQEFDK